MKKITLEIDGQYATLLTFTVVGVCDDITRVATFAVDLAKVNHIVVDENAKIVPYNDK